MCAEGSHFSASLLYCRTPPPSLSDPYLWLIIILFFLRVVEVFIEQNPHCVHWRNNSLETPLHMACKCSGNLRTRQCLIDAKADVNAKLVVHNKQIIIAHRLKT